MRYIELTVTEGRKFLPNIRNLFFKSLVEENFFVEPWANRELGDCAEFRLDTGNDRFDEVLFFANDVGLIDFLSTSTGELFLFGAYNQVTVCQMRARGTVTIASSHPEIEQIKMRRRDAIEKRIDAGVRGLDQNEAKERYRLLAEGILFSFRINAYAYRIYDRG